MQDEGMGSLVLVLTEREETKGSSRDGGTRDRAIKEEEHGDSNQSLVTHISLLFDQGPCSIFDLFIGFWIKEQENLAVATVFLLCSNSIDLLLSSSSFPTHGPLHLTSLSSILFCYHDPDQMIWVNFTWFTRSP